MIDATEHCPQPDQSMVQDDQGVVRFRANRIVRWLVDWFPALADGKDVLTAINEGQHSPDDLAQFYQLIGYSVSGYGDLHLVSEEKLSELDAAAERIRLGGSNEHL